ncbi:hypothetical protein [Rheinheimera mangrovi]|uniref:hypothetical protein n=1 Tax=Rheinheimera mangrovi TaxID=2498451 RepID=UPI00197D977A|nr:hypothetical protein [Rheinheimera mangrovi]
MKTLAAAAVVAAVVAVVAVAAVRLLLLAIILRNTLYVLKAAFVLTGLKLK